MATAKSSKDDTPQTVPVADGTEHGYIGQVRPDKDRDAFTVAGVTGGTANVADTPTSVSAKSSNTPKSSGS